MGSAMSAVGQSQPRSVGSTQRPQSGPASVSTSATASRVNGSRSSPIGYVHSFASGTTMSRLVSAVGTSQPPRRSTPARQELPTRTRNASAARAATDDLPGGPADPGDAVSPRPDDRPDRQRPDGHEVEPEDEAEAPAHRSERAHGRPHQPVPECAALLRARLAERCQEQAIRSSPRDGRLALVHVQRIVQQRRACVISVARDEPPEERRHGGEIRPAGRVGRDDRGAALVLRRGIEVLAGHEEDDALVGVSSTSAVAEASEEHERVLVDLPKLRVRRAVSGHRGPVLPGERTERHDDLLDPTARISRA